MAIWPGLAAASAAGAGVAGAAGAGAVSAAGAGAGAGAGAAAAWALSARDRQANNLAASLGTGERNTGLIKSLREDGTWEGSVYAVPFRTAIRVEEVATRSEGARISTAAVDGLEGGDQLEVNFRARASAATKLHFKVTHLGTALPGLSREFEVTPTAKNFRIIVRSPLPASGIVLTLEPVGSVNLADLKVFRQTAEIARLHRGKMTGIRNRGGVTFDLLEP